MQFLSTFVRILKLFAKTYSISTSVGLPVLPFANFPTLLSGFVAGKVDNSNEKLNSGKYLTGVPTYYTILCRISVVLYMPAALFSFPIYYFVFKIKKQSFIPFFT